MDPLTTLLSNSHVSNQYSFRINNLSWRFWSVNQQKKTYAASTASTTSTSSSKFYVDDDDDDEEEEEEMMNIPEEPLFRPQQEKGKSISLLSIMLQQDKEYKATVLHRCKRYHHHLNEFFSSAGQQERRS